MPELSRTQLEQVVSEVIFLLEKHNDQPCLSQSALPCILVIGDTNKLSLEETKGYQVVGLENYTDPQDIEKYQKIYITTLSASQLADIALGRDSKGAGCAVTNALLRGKSVILFESALSHRRFIGTATKGIYTLYESYVDTLKALGVSICLSIPKDNDTSAKVYSQTLEKALNITYKKGLVTENMARNILIEKPNGTISFEKGSILTPSAKDTFKSAKRNYEII